jgi:hypothetical protein
MPDVRLCDAGILPDGTLHNPGGYPDDIVRAAVHAEGERCKRLCVGTIEYKGGDTPAALVRPLTLPTAAKTQPQPAHEKMDDEIPF